MSKILISQKIILYIIIILLIYQIISKIFNIINKITKPKIPIIKKFKPLLSYTGSSLINKVAILIPIYERDYHFLNGIFTDILNNLNKVQFDIIFILTYKKDVKIFNEEIKKYTGYNINELFFLKIIILENYITIDQIQKLLDNHVIIIYKKLFSMYLLTLENKKTNNYKYIWNIDSEIRFNNFDNFEKTSEEFCKRKIIYAGYNIGNDLIINSSINYFNKEEQKKLEPLRSLFYWYNEIPINDMEILPNFLSYIKINDFDYFIKSFNWFKFDYCIYIYYCYLYYDYKIIKINCINSLESIYFNYFKQLEKKINIHWTNGINYNIVKNNKKYHLIYHLDRNIISFYTFYGIKCIFDIIYQFFYK
jgi:hypothetical protein